MPQSTTEDWATMPPSFVIDFLSLLLLGPHATMFVATAGAVTQRLTDSEQAHASRRMLVNAGTVMAAIQAAGLVHRTLGARLAISFGRCRECQSRPLLSCIAS